MDAPQTIAVSTIKLKRKELVVIAEQALAKYQDAQEKIKHIDFILGQFTEDKGQVDLLPKTTPPLNTNEAIIQVLKNAKEELAPAHIYHGILQLGLKTTRGSFNVALSRLTTTEGSPVKRSSEGKYSLHS